jgi:osmotically-inducible protein OsmY
LALFTLAITPSLAQQNQRRQNQPRQNEQQQQRDRVMDQNQMGAGMLDHRVAARLARSRSLAGSEINVNSEGQTVTLRGTVESEEAKQRAERLAMKTTGVREVRNELTVDKQAVAARRNVNVSDADLSKQVAERLVREVFPGARVDEDFLFGWEVEGATFEVEVEVDDGHVTLEGDVPAREDIFQAIQATRNVPGVRSVDSDLRIDRTDFGYYPYYWHPYPYY